MKTRITLFQILLLVITVGAALGMYMQIKGRKEPTKYLEERLKQQNVPVSEIKVLQQSPLQIEVIVRSMSDDDKGMPEDAINMLLVHHETILANQRGCRIDGVTRVLINKMGKRIFGVFDSLDTKKVPPQLPRSAVSDAATEKAAKEKIKLHGLALANTKVSSVEGIQTLNLELSSSSIEEANHLLPQFIPSLYATIPALNAAGSQIALYKVEVRDQNGNMLFTYIRDIQLGHETWWMADGITVDW